MNRSRSICDGASVLNRVRFWDQEYSLTALLVMLVVTLFVVAPPASGTIIGSAIMLCFAAALTITGVTVNPPGEPDCARWRPPKRYLVSRIRQS
jgi:hypothetical protein